MPIEPVDGGGSPYDRIVNAGRKLFFLEGFSAISTLRLAKEAGVSKTTIYTYFGDMTGVLRAVSAAENRVFAVDAAEMPATALDFKESLIDFGEHPLRMISDPDVIQFDHVMHEQSRDNPEITATYFESCYGGTQAHLIHLLDHGRGLGFLQSVISSMDLADHLICLWEGLDYKRVRLGLQPKSRSDLRAWSAQCVNALLDL